MGTFIESLSAYMREQSAKASEKECRIAKMEAELKAAVSRLHISEGEKKNLQNQISELRKSSIPAGSVAFAENAALNSLSADFTKAFDASGVLRAAWLNPSAKKCRKCGKDYNPGTLAFLASDLCDNCRILSN
jgi:hypothetical protein